MKSFVRKKIKAAIEQLKNDIADGSIDTRDFTTYYSTDSESEALDFAKQASKIIDLEKYSILYGGGEVTIATHEAVDSMGGQSID